MAELDMKAYGKSKGRPSKEMKAMKKYDKSFDANARRMGVSNPNFKKSEIDKLIQSKVDQEVRDRMSQFEKKGYKNVPTNPTQGRTAAGYGRITATKLPNPELKYNDIYSPAKYDTQFGSKSSGWTADNSGSSKVIDGSKFAKQKYGDSYSVNTSASDPLSRVVAKSRAGVPADISAELPPPIPTAAEQAVASTAANLDNAKKVNAIDKVKSAGKKVRSKMGGRVGGLVRGYGGYDVGERLASGAAGLFTDNETIKSVAGTLGGLAGGAAATMIPILRTPALVYGAVKGAADVWDMMKEPSNVEDAVEVEQAAPKQPTMVDALLADLLSGKSGKGGKSKSDDALATMLALANQGTAEANARAKRMQAMSDAGMLDVDILK